MSQVRQHFLFCTSLEHCAVDFPLKAEFECFPILLRQQKSGKMLWCAMLKEWKDWDRAQLVFSSFLVLCLLSGQTFSMHQRHNSTSWKIHTHHQKALIPLYVGSELEILLKVLIFQSGHLKAMPWMFSADCYWLNCLFWAAEFVESQELNHSDTELHLKCFMAWLHASAIISFMRENLPKAVYSVFEWRLFMFVQPTYDVICISQAEQFNIK